MKRLFQYLILGWTLCIAGQVAAQNTLTLTPERTLSLADIDAVAIQHKKITLSQQAWDNVAAGHQVVLQAALNNMPVYGLTVGVGWNKDHPVFQEHNGHKILSSELLTLSKKFNLSSLRAHAAGLGEPFPEDVVRASMLIRLNTFLNGEAGVSTEVAKQYVAFLNQGITPIVPSRGSVGEGDITLASHIGLAMVGEWDVWYQGKRQPAKLVMAKTGLKPLEPVGKDFLSILSNNSLVAADAHKALTEAKQFYRRQLVLFALMLEGFNGNVAPFTETVNAVRPYPEVQQAASDVRNLLAGSDLWKVDPKRSLQDPLSFRSMAYSLGEVQHAIKQLEAALNIQINHSDDNPVVLIHSLTDTNLPSQIAQYQVTGTHAGAIMPTSNFNFLPVTTATSQLNESLAKLAEVMTQQLLRMENPELTKLPRFLAAEDNHGHAFGAIQKPFVATNNQIKAWAQPQWFASATLAGNIEDTVSMSAQTVAHTHQIISGLYEIAAFQLLHGSQALDLRTEFTASQSTKKVLQAYRKQVPFITQDTPYTPLIERSIHFWQTYPVAF